MIGFVIFMLVIGLVSGFIARALVPGNDAMNVGATIILGIVGSLLGGFLGYVLFRDDASHGAFQASGIIGSIVGSIIALLILRAANGRNAHSHL